MSGSIYYVGSRKLNENRQSHIPTNRASHFQRDKSQQNKRINTSKSTSCPKTQRSRYAISMQRFRKQSPLIRPIHFTYTNSNKQNLTTFGSYNVQQLLTVKEKPESQLSSAFQRINIKNINKHPIPVKKIFKKVQQPRFRQKITSLNNEEYIDQKSYKGLQKSSKQNYINNRISDINNQKPSSIIKNQIQQSIDEQYRIQPLDKLFLCTRCYQFTPVIELRAHHMNCFIPLKKNDFVSKWLKIINLLRQVYRQKQSNQLFRLFDRMQWYISQCDIGKRQGYILYSEQLASILSMKGSINAVCLNQSDLFWLIQSVGDLIETKSIDLEETAFWKICT